MLAMFLEVAINVFHHHYRGIDHHADTDGQAAQRSEVRRQSRIPHENKGDEHAEGYGRGRDQRTAKISKQQEQDYEDQQFSFDERFNDRVHAVINQFSLVVKVDNAHAFGQGLVNLGNLSLDTFNYLLGVFVDTLEDDAGDYFPLAVFSHRALADLVAD